MAQWIRELTVKSDDLQLIPETHMVEEWTPKLSSDLYGSALKNLQEHTRTHAHSLTHRKQ